MYPRVYRQLQSAPALGTDRAAELAAMDAAIRAKLAWMQERRVGEFDVRPELIPAEGPSNERRWRPFAAASNHLFDRCVRA